jgi:hypothetical protein
MLSLNRDGVETGMVRYVLRHVIQETDGLVDRAWLWYNENKIISQ